MNGVQRCRTRRTSHAVHLHAGLALLLLLAVTQSASPAVQQAGTVRGRAVEAATGRPLPGVFVLLLDSAGVRRGGVLSNGEGWFMLRPHQPGSYTVRLELIGYATHDSRPFVVIDEPVVLEEIALRQTAIALESIEVEATDARCRLPRDVGEATVHLWTEARKALTIAAWGEREAGVAYQVMQYSVARDVLTRDIVRERPVERRVLSGVGRTPFTGTPAEELAELGYIRSDAQSHTYYGLDATTLLSTAFMETHCFRLRLGPPGSELVGLAFEPVPGRAEPDVEGVLWIDRRTMEIQLLEYRYTRLHIRDVPLDLFGGRTAFERLPNGAWIVGDWWIRMPEGGRPIAAAPRAIGARPPRLERLRAAGLGIREDGGAIRFLGVGDAPSAEPERAIISGMVWDSTRNRPLVGAIVFVHGTPHAVRTDRMGRFRVTNLARAEYSIGFFHPYTDSLGMAIRLLPVRAEVDGGAPVMLFVPPVDGCAAGEADPRAEAAVVHVAGYVFDRRGVPADDTSVTVTWDGGAVSVLAGDDGSYAVCGVPAGARIRVDAPRTRSPVLDTPAAGVFRYNIVLR